ncbi:MAG: hypothetical protein WBM46_00010 [Polyangiales bacterium]
MSNFTMISTRKTTRRWVLGATLIAVAACGDGRGAIDSEGAVIDPPAQCSGDRPDCSLSEDFPVAADLNAENSAGLRYSEEAGSLVIDRVTVLPDADGDGVPDDADDCPGTPDWRTCDDDPTNDGMYQTLFYDPTGADEVVRRSVVPVTSDIPRIDVYFLVDATPTLAEEIAVLQAEILNIVDDVRSSFADARFGVGLYREYPLDPLASAYSQAPYHHVLDLTNDAALLQTAVATLNTVSNKTDESAATQALYSVASGRGLGDFVPNRGSCPSAPDAADVGYPCFRPDALHVVMNITDAAVINGPIGPQYGDPQFAPGIGMGVTGVMNLPPVEMFPALFDADSSATALDLGDLSARSLTLMGMSTGLTNQVDTANALGCDTMSGVPPGFDMDGKDVVLALRFDSLVSGVEVFANNTHWPGANVALFDDALLDPAAALECDGGTVGLGNWGFISWDPTTSQQYYLVADGIIPAAEPGHMPEGAFSISIVHDGDPANPSWLTTDAPVAWNDVEAALLASDIRVASVVTLKDAMTMTSDGNGDARLIAAATDALTKVGGEWVTEVASANGEGLDSAISNTIALVKNDSGFDIALSDADNPGTGFDERLFVETLRHQDCAEGEPLGCDNGSGNTCNDCTIGALLTYEVIFANRSVAPTSSSQRFDFELVVRADDAVEVERIPVRVLVPDAAAHDFRNLPGTSFYRNVYDSTARCITPPERPKWGNLTWSGTTPGDSTIEFQIRTAPTIDDLQTATPAVVVIPTDTTSSTLNLTEELIADGQSYGLPYIQITAVLNPSTSPLATPTLEGWTFEFVCEAAE